MNNQSGFTIVEIIVTVSLIAIFIMTLLMSYEYISTQHEHIKRNAKANDIARMNLSKFTSVGSLSLSSCSSHSNILSGKEEPTPAGNYQNLTQRVAVSYPRGCDNPPQVSSIVEYGPSSARERIVHNSYAR